MSELQELFDKDPLQLTKPDIRRIVERLREARGQFNAGNASAGKVKAPKVSAAKKAEAESFLKDLGI